MTAETMLLLLLLLLSMLCFVSRGRQRYVDEEFDLDLSYITDRVIGKLYVIRE